jgi:DNA polymerase-3 subunit epsilon
VSLPAFKHDPLEPGAKPDGVLVGRALDALSGGPLPTPMLAARVLGISGNAGAAASAIFGLLGNDRRFSVSPQGVWSLSLMPADGRMSDLLAEQDWVVVDVETTGGTPETGHRITEVAAVHISHGEIRDVFSTLVNPERSIPSMITQLTGITNRMVADAPRFADIAPRLGTMLKNRVFVAHNAAFDWGFVSAELARTVGTPTGGRQLCTVRLARKLLPELTSRALGALAVHFNLEIESHHRATDDAVATAKLLLRFIEMLEEREVREWSELEHFLRKRAPRASKTRMPRSMDRA